MIQAIPSYLEKQKIMNTKSLLRKPLYSILLVLFIVSGSKVNAQYVNIPDPTFKAWVLANIPHPTSATDITPAKAAGTNNIILPVASLAKGSYRVVIKGETIVQKGFIKE